MRNNRDITNIDELVAHHKKQIARMDLANTIFTEIAKIGETMKDKQLNKRLATKIQERYPKYTIYYEYKKVFEWHELRIWGDGIEYNDALYMSFRDWKDFFESCERWTYKNSIGSQSTYQAQFELDNLKEITKDLEALKDAVKSFKEKYTRTDTEPDFGRDITYALKDLLVF